MPVTLKFYHTVNRNLGLNYSYTRQEKVSQSGRPIINNLI